MERFIWLLTFVPARLLLVVIGTIDFYLYSSLCDKGLLENTILCCLEHNKRIIIITLIISTICAIVGAVLGYKYVEMGRSRRWHYHATKYDDYNNQLHNTLYWAGKFALLPIILLLLIIFTYEIGILG